MNIIRKYQILFEFFNNLYNLFQIWSIVGLFFCPCIGIASLMYTLSSRTERNNGNIKKALKKADLAKRLGAASVLIGLFLLVVHLIDKSVETSHTKAAGHYNGNF